MGVVMGVVGVVVVIVGFACLERRHAPVCLRARTHATLAIFRQSHQRRFLAMFTQDGSLSRWPVVLVYPHLLPHTAAYHAALGRAPRPVTRGEWQGWQSVASRLG